MGAARTILVAVAGLAIGGAAGAWIASTSGHHDTPQIRFVSTTTREGLPGYVPLGDLAGAAKVDLPAFIDNPLAHDAQAVEEGHRLFIRMNCAGCHGYNEKGGMGPDLTDRFWRYGGTPVQIYKSIYEGRPKGMPAWGKALPERAIWQLTAFIQSLGGSFPPQAYQQGLEGDEGAAGSKPHQTATTGLPEGQ